MVRYFVKVTVWALKMVAIGASASLVVLSFNDVQSRAVTEEEKPAVSVDTAWEEPKEIDIEEEMKAGAGRFFAQPPVSQTEAQEKVIINLSDSDGEVLKRIAMAEAGGETVEGKALVMRVVLNRKDDPVFPDTVEGVVMQEGQFSTIPNGSYRKCSPDEGCDEALKLVKTGWDESKGAVYFESCKNESWQSRNCSFLFEYGGHKFYK